VRRTFLLAGAVPIAAALLLSGCTSSPSHSAAATATSSAPAGTTATIQASVTACGRGWDHPQPGQQELQVKNTDIVGGEIYLTDAKTGNVYAFLEPVAPGTSATMSIDLGSGSYAFKCAMEDQDVVTGPTITIPGTAKGSSPAVAPVSQGDMIVPTKQYEAYVNGRLPQLSTQVAVLRADLVAGNLAKARTDWLTAHQSYERLGAAYDAFGDIDGAINGTANGYADGVKDKDFTGFHRIEYGLWHGQSAAGLVPFGTQLVADVATLRKTFPTTQIDPLDVSIRAHEITENALQFELTGETDYGSHSNLATVSANLDGTTTVVGMLDQILTPRYPELSQMQRQLAQAKTDVAATDVNGRWLALDQLSRAQRERINADISELSEQLAPIASICEPRRTS
jgi:iron uptake system component EfeO